MYTKAVVLALAASVAAHSAVPMVKGDAGGAMTALGIDPSIPIQDRNKNVIEPDANQMPSKRDPTANGLGSLNGKKRVTMDMLDTAVKNAGAGGIPKAKDSLDITYRQMVLDGRFDQTRGAQVLIDPTATGNFKAAVKAEVVQAPQVVRTPTIARTTIVGTDMPMKVKIPEGIKCAGPQGTCLVRVVNGANEGNNLWGGHFLFQQEGAAAGGAAAAAAVPATGNAARAAAVVRDVDNLKKLVADLNKIQVRSEPEADEEPKLQKREDTVTEADMKKFEASN